MRDMDNKKQKFNVVKALVFTYIVVLQNSDNDAVSLAFTGTFNQVLKKAKFVCPNDYFIREIRVA